MEKHLGANIINAYDDSTIFLLTFDCLEFKGDKTENLCECVSICTVYFCAACHISGGVGEQL